MCLEISEIPEFIKDDDLDDCVLKFFNERDTPVDLANFEACHRLKLKARPKKVIIKLFPKGKVCSVFYNVRRN